MSSNTWMEQRWDDCPVHVLSVNDMHLTLMHAHDSSTPESEWDHGDWWVSLSNSWRYADSQRMDVCRMYLQAPEERGEQGYSLGEAKLHALGMVREWLADAMLGLDHCERQIGNSDRRWQLAEGCRLGLDADADGWQAELRGSDDSLIFVERLQQQEAEWAISEAIRLARKFVAPLLARVAVAERDEAVR